MKTEEHKIRVEKTARYFTAGCEATEAEELWIGLHGYGQLPQYFLRKFIPLDNGKRRFVAVEGLHRFYVEGTSGRVGASWMTKEARLDDIADQGRYLDQVLELLQQESSNLKRIGLLGFSQGVSTSCRWMDHRMGKDIDHLICWAGSFPPDIDYALNKEAFDSVQFDAVFGDEDEYIPEEKLEELMSQLHAFDIRPELHRYQGGHSVDSNLLKTIIENAH